MFDISIARSAKNQGTRVLLDIDKSPLGIPPALTLGTGDRQARLEAHYANCIGEKGNTPAAQRLFQFFCYIYGIGKKDNKGLHLVCACPQHKYHAQEVKAFLQDNEQLLDIASGYMTQDTSKPVARTQDDGGLSLKEVLDSATTSVQHPEDRERLEEEMKQMTMGGGSKVQLPPEEMAQIQRLIQEDQARDAALAQKPQEQQLPDTTNESLNKEVDNA